MSERQRVYATRHPFYWIAKLVRNRAKRTHRKVIGVDSFFLEQLWNSQNGLCALSGRPMRLDVVEKVGWKFQCDRVSVDRIDPDGDYTPNHVQLVRAGINIAKNARKQEAFISLCCDVADFHRHNNQTL